MPFSGDTYRTVKANVPFVAVGAQAPSKPQRARRVFPVPAGAEGATRVGSLASLDAEAEETPDDVLGAEDAETSADAARIAEDKAQGTGAFAFGSLGAVADELWDRGDATDDDILEAFLDWTADRGVSLWQHQEDACMDLAVGDNLILGTPTGSGKSLVALMLHFRSLCRDERSYYTAPIKALVSEKFFKLVKYFGRDYVGMVTGDTTINPTAPIVCCTAEILANRALREGAATEAASVAMDEFHFFSDSDRGWAWQVPLLTLPHTQFLLMSATLGDTTQIEELVERKTGVTVDVIADAPRPVPLAYEYVETPLEATVELALRDGSAPLYIVHFSQDAALASASALASYGVAEKPQRQKIKDAIKGTKFTTAFGKTLRRLLEAGVGVHHAGMLPRYRLLVEKLAQQGLLPVICGTDTLGVGINVPIHTVVLTQLTKYDGSRMRRLRAREFHQIAGRAGRSGFDTEGLVIAEAPEYDIENARALAKAGDDPKKRRRVKRKSAPEGFVTWNKSTFERLIAATPEALKPRLRITHSMILAEVVQGGDAFARVQQLIADSMQTDDEKAKLVVRASEMFTTLIDAGVVEREEGEDGAVVYRTTVDIPETFALDQPLSPFLLAALELLDPDSDTYELDVVSMVEATLEDPRQVLRAQQRKERDRAMARMKADGVDYDERMERIAEVTYKKPLEDLLNSAFDQYCAAVPWARDFELSPKSVVRDMLETAANFKGYIAALDIARSEGTLLRYLSDAFRVLDRTVPADKRTEKFDDIVAWLGFIVRSVDSSLVDEWESSGVEFDDEPPQVADAVVRDRRAVTVLVRNALFERVKLIADRNVDGLGTLDAEWGFGKRPWHQVVEEVYAAHEYVDTDADARSSAYFSIDESDEQADHVWHVHQTLKDSDGDRDFGIRADVDLDATQDTGDVVFKNFRAGSFEELADED
ncbi:MAG: DUF3516 domain-containing protein [Eggerthellaceae bacterium]|jgi:superfamily II RNA helicase